MQALSLPSLPLLSFYAPQEKPTMRGRPPRMTTESVETANTTNATPTSVSAAAAVAGVRASGAPAVSITALLCSPSLTWRAALSCFHALHPLGRGTETAAPVVPPEAIFGLCHRLLHPSQEPSQWETRAPRLGSTEPVAVSPSSRSREAPRMKAAGAILHGHATGAVDPLRQSLPPTSPSQWRTAESSLRAASVLTRALSAHLSRAEGAKPAATGSAREHELDAALRIVRNCATHGLTAWYVQDMMMGFTSIDDDDDGSDLRQDERGANEGPPPCLGPLVEHQLHHWVTRGRTGEVHSGLTRGLCALSRCETDDGGDTAANGDASTQAHDRERETATTAATRALFASDVSSSPSWGYRSSERGKGAVQKALASDSVALLTFALLCRACRHAWHAERHIRLAAASALTMVSSREVMNSCPEAAECVVGSRRKARETEKEAEKREALALRELILLVTAVVPAVTCLAVLRTVTEGVRWVLERAKEGNIAVARAHESDMERERRSAAITNAVMEAVEGFLVCLVAQGVATADSPLLVEALIATVRHRDFKHSSTTGEVSSGMNLVAPIILYPDVVHALAHNGRVSRADGAVLPARCMQALMTPMKCECCGSENETQGDGDNESESARWWRSALLGEFTLLPDASVGTTAARSPTQCSQPLFAKKDTDAWVERWTYSYLTLASWIGRNAGRECRAQLLALGFAHLTMEAFSAAAGGTSDTIVTPTSTSVTNRSGLAGKHVWRALHETFLPTLASAEEQGAFFSQLLAAVPAGEPRRWLLRVVATAPLQQPLLPSPLPLCLTRTASVAPESAAHSANVSLVSSSVSRLVAQWQPSAATLADEKSGASAYTVYDLVGVVIQQWARDGSRSLTEPTRLLADALVVLPQTLSLSSTSQASRLVMAFHTSVHARGLAWESAATTSATAATTTGTQEAPPAVAERIDWHWETASWLGLLRHLPPAAAAADDTALTVWLYWALRALAAAEAGVDPCETPTSDNENLASSVSASKDDGSSRVSVGARHTSPACTPVDAMDVARQLSMCLDQLPMDSVVPPMLLNWLVARVAGLSWSQAASALLQGRRTETTSAVADANANPAPGTRTLLEDARQQEKTPPPAFIYLALPLDHVTDTQHALRVLASLHHAQRDDRAHQLPRPLSLPSDERALTTPSITPVSGKRADNIGAAGGETGRIRNRGDGKGDYTDDGAISTAVRLLGGRVRRALLHTWRLRSMEAVLSFIRQDVAGRATLATTPIPSSSTTITTASMTSPLLSMCNEDRTRSEVDAGDGDTGRVASVSGGAAEELARLLSRLRAEEGLTSEVSLTQESERAAAMTAASLPLTASLTATGDSITTPLPLLTALVLGEHVLQAHCLADVTSPRSIQLQQQQLQAHRQQDDSFASPSPPLPDGHDLTPMKLTAYSSDSSARVSVGGPVSVARWLTGATTRRRVVPHVSAFPHFHRQPHNKGGEKSSYHATCGSVVHRLRVALHGQQMGTAPGGEERVPLPPLDAALATSLLAVADELATVERMETVRTPRSGRGDCQR